MGARFDKANQCTMAMRSHWAGLVRRELNEASGTSDPSIFGRGAILIGGRHDGERSIGCWNLAQEDAEDEVFKDLGD